MTELAKLTQEAETVRAACAAVAVLPCATQAEIDALGFGLKDIKARLKFLEAERKARTAPGLAAIETIRAEYRAPEEAYAALEVATKARIARAGAEQRAAELAAHTAALASQLAAHMAAQAGDVRAAVALQQRAFQAITAAPEALKTAGVSSRFEWRVRVVRPELVPRALCLPDTAAILANVRTALGKADGKDVQPTSKAAWDAIGVEVYSHEIVVAR